MIQRCSGLVWQAVIFHGSKAQEQLKGINTVSEPASSPRQSLEELYAMVLENSCSTGPEIDICGQMVACGLVCNRHYCQQHDHLVQLLCSLIYLTKASISTGVLVPETFLFQQLIEFIF